jgi:cbb3-type cytochrome oxidase subunit 3
MATLDWIILILFFSCLVGIVFWVFVPFYAHNKVFTMREFY